MNQGDLTNDEMIINLQKLEVKIFNGVLPKAIKYSLAMATDQLRWRSVEDWLPEDGQEVQVYNYMMASGEYGHICFWPDELRMFTHWRPVQPPEPSKDE